MKTSCLSLPMPANCSKPCVSIVIPVKNSTATLGELLESLSNQRSAPPFQIIISDNGSDDGLQDLLADSKTKYPQLSLVYADASDKLGAAHARNVGANIADSPIILFCDSDDVAAPEWVRSLAEGLESYDSVGGALDERSLNPPKSLPRTYAAERLPVGLNFLPYPIGTNCGVRRDVWRLLAGFDETYTFGGEEVEFFWRLQVAGFTLGFIPQAIVIFRHRNDVGGSLRREFRHGVSSCRLMAQFKEHIPNESIVQILHAWMRTLVRVPLVMIPGRRLNFLRRVAHQFGQVVGCFRYRVVHLA